jgi:hypothetical protein
MKRVTIRIDSIRVSGLDGAAARALPGGLEAAVRRQIEGMPASNVPANVTRPHVHAAIDGTRGNETDEVAAAVAEAIGAAARRGGPR